MLKVAIVGCGKIADSHASQIQRIKGAEIVGVCDREPLMARQLCERFPIRQSFTEPTELLERARPDVVHITTPPESHFNVARLCLQAGCHVYVEKPFTVYEHEAQQLIALANDRGRKLTAGHDNQFSHAARGMRALVQSGFLGGEPVHMESYFCYELGPGGYAEILLSDKKHWVRRLPGQLLQNVISHGIARIAEFLKTDSPEVIAHGFVSPLLRGMGETEIIDELRVIISEQERTTAYFTFSSQMRPSLHQFRIYGPKNGLLVDQDQELLIKLHGSKLKSYLEQFVSPAQTGRQYFANTFRNVRSFLARDFHPKTGMKYLIESFYRSIVEDTPVPIPYREILLTARIMDCIFAQLNRRLQTGLAGDDSPLEALSGRKCS
ncbi:MAG TPA: Gfo/Idh/MocA family oxidoreductase [Candidatus Dormibacteraeota bacterium]|nr:Gfo/Idh/MocA family oxidoreductase [Candidatus Dormibacteraeota bacterium]